MTELREAFGTPDYTFSPLTLDKLIGGCPLPKTRKADNYQAPAVYAWRDADTGEVVYIGKAINVRNRLQRHWYGSDWVLDWLASGAVPVVDVYMVQADKRAGIERSMIDVYAPRYNRRKD